VVIAVWFPAAGLDAQTPDRVSQAAATDGNAAPPAARRAKGKPRRLAPRGNPTHPGLDRCGISAAAVCPLR